MLAHNPRCEEVLSNLVAMFLDKRDHDSVRRYAAMLSEIQPDSATATEALAALAFQDGDYAAAAKHCRALADGSGPWRTAQWAFAVSQFSGLLTDAGYSVKTVSPVDLP